MMEEEKGRGRGRATHEQNTQEHTQHKLSPRGLALTKGSAMSMLMSKGTLSISIGADVPSANGVFGSPANSEEPCPSALTTHRRHRQKRRHKPQADIRELHGLPRAAGSQAPGLTENSRYSREMSPLPSLVSVIGPYKLSRPLFCGGGVHRRLM